jgi:hypothetical protein
MVFLMALKIFQSSYDTGYVRRMLSDTKHSLNRKDRISNFDFLFVWFLLTLAIHKRRIFIAEG